MLVPGNPPAGLSGSVFSLDEVQQRLFPHQDFALEMST